MKKAYELLLVVNRRLIIHVKLWSMKYFAFY
jgi:hypothetical protein